MGWTDLSQRNKLKSNDERKKEEKTLAKVTKYKRTKKKNISQNNRKWLFGYGESEGLLAIL